MSQDLAAVYEELNRLKEAGIERVAIAPETLKKLAALDDTPSPAGTPTPPQQDKAKNSTPAPVKLETDTPKPETPIAPLFPDPPVVELPDGEPEQQLEALRAIVQQCETCNAHLSTEGKVVFGTGSVDADIFFIGEAPGAEEALAGEPFVGPAGQLLTKIITAMGLKRESVYIANILKWRPEHDKPYGNRAPTLEEMNFCMPYLKAQIEIVKPKVLIALGNTAVTGLLGPDPQRRMGQVRGKWHQVKDIDLMITFHPAYLLRNDTLKTKRMVWEDMLAVMNQIGMEISEQQKQFFLPKN